MKTWAIVVLALVAVGGAVGASILVTQDDRPAVVRPTETPSEAIPGFNVAPQDSPTPSPSPSESAPPSGGSSGGRIVPVGGSSDDTRSSRGPEGSTINAKEGAFAEASEGQDEEEAEREAEEEEAEAEEDEARAERRDDRDDDE